MYVDKSYTVLVLVMMPPRRGISYILNNEVTCEMCEWDGHIQDCKEAYENSIKFLSGRQAYIYYCPKCNHIIEENVLVMS